MTEAEAITKYRPYVLKVAKQFSGSGVAWDDLVQEGLIAVAMAYRSWRPDGGASFLTWIRMPVYFAISKAARDHGRGGGTFRGGDGSKDKKVQLISFDAPIRGDDAESDSEYSVEGSFHDALGTFEEPPDPFVMGRLPGLVASLDKQQRQVIRLRFDKGLSYAEVGVRLKMSRELARQIEQGALARLKELMQGEGDDA